MAKVRRDYYDLLGVARDADEAAIKKAFRRLARELHPDVSDDPGAEERFREIAEAYEVLSKAETRELYDRYGHDGLRTGGYRPTDFDFGNLSDLFGALFGEDVFGGMGGRARQRRGADVQLSVEVDLADVAEGVTREVGFEVAAGCRRCAGSGAEPGTELETCPQCGGSGRIQQVSRVMFGQFVTAQPCGQCSGSGRIVTTPCSECRGWGRVPEERHLEVRVPAGIHDGQRIRLRGEGHGGEAGAGPGDAYVLVRVRPDARFVREGDDIISSAQLTIAQAALGATVEVPTLDGSVELEFRPGTQPGDVRVLKGKGLPVLQGRHRGDQHVVVNVVVPKRLTDEQRHLLEELSASLGEPEHVPGESFFDRIRAVFQG